MTRFRAINDTSSESDDDNEEKETKEAQEERAFAQYNQGLRLHSEKKYGEAEQIYANLLDSPFLEQITCDSADGSDSLVRPAAALKYGCLKNLGEVLVIRGSIQQGLDCYLQALELDNSDVTLWHRAGKVALKVNRLDLASCAFQQALQCNPRYWPSLDALIPVLYALGDTMGCLVLCCRTLQLDRGYPLARAFRARILKERPSLTEDLAAFDIHDCDIPMGRDDDSEELVKIATDLQDLWRESEKAFLEPKLSGIEEKPLTVTVSSLSWLAVGRALLQLYRRISSSDPAVSFLNAVKLELASSDSAANSKGSTPPSGTGATEGESDTDAEEQTEEDATEASGQEQEDANKMGTRKRRRSSISLLDPYKRRSMRVRNGVRREQEKEDTSLADMLRSLLPPTLHITNIETESESEKRRKDVRRLADALAWGDDSDDAAVELCRLLEQREVEAGQARARQNRHVILAKKLEEEGYFGSEKESKDVQAFVELGEGNIILDVLSSFLRRLCSLGSLAWPVGLPRVYTEVYQYYRCHNRHPSTFNVSVSTEDIKSDAELTLLFNELFLDRMTQNDRQNKHYTAASCQLLKDGMTQMSMLVGRPEIVGTPSGRSLILRGMWFRVLYSLHKDDSPSAIHALKEIIYFIENCIGEEDLKKRESPLPVKDDYSESVMTSENKTEKVEQSKDKISTENSVQGIITDKSVVVVKTDEVSTEVVPAEVSTEVPAVVPTEVVPAEVSTEVVPAEVPTEVVPAEVPIEVVLAQVSTDVVPAELSTEVVPPEVCTEVVPAEVCTEVVPAEVYTEVISSKLSPELTLVEEKMDVDAFGGNQLEEMECEKSSAAVKPGESEETKDFKDVAKIQSEYSVVLPNCVNNYIINKVTVQRLLTTLTRKQQLKRMEQLYESGQFSDLVDMLADCFKFCAQQVDNGSENEEFENLPDRPTQMAMLLDALWQLERYSDCLFWAEACLHEAHGRYLNHSEENREQQVWATVVENILIGMDKCLALSPTLPLKALPPTRLSRLVQTLSSLLCHQLDQQDAADVSVECTTAWLLMYRVTRFEESNLQEGDLSSVPVPRSLRVLFTAHDHMAKRGWCSQGEGRLLLAILDGVLTHLRRPELHAVREEMAHQAEQAIFCLFKHPQKAKEQGRKRYLQDHKVPSQLTLTLDRAMQLLEFVRPDELPQFDSLADASIDTDCEALLKRIADLIPQELLPPRAREELRTYFKGESQYLPVVNYSLPVRAADLFYLLADYYHKSRSCDKYEQAIKYYVEDICANPKRFDSWASMALARSAVLNKKLNSCDRLNVDKMLAGMSEAKRCFQRALELDENNIIIIEFGSFAYCMHSYCSRLLKADPNDTNVDMFDEMLSAASKCFTTASKVAQDEPWLPEYMLGKIAEKRGEEPATFLRHYQMAAMLLDESGAEYPIFLEYDSKRRLACEAHEVHYRIHASILKQLVNSLCRPINTATYELYRCCLAKFAEGPFMKATRQAVPHLNELLEVRGSFQPSASAKPAKVRHAKRKSSEKSERSEKSEKSSDESAAKKVKVETETGTVAVPKETDTTAQPEAVTENNPAEQTTNPTEPQVEVKKECASPNAGTSSSSSSSSSTDSSSDSDSSSSSGSSGSGSSSDSSDSDDSSDSSAAEDEKKTSAKADAENGEGAKEKTGKETETKTPKRTPPTESFHEVGPLVRACVYAMEECLLRYPRHYKSLYRLAHYYYSPGEHRDLDKCWQLLLGKYHVERANRYISGLFKSDNFRTMFSDIWRIQSEEVDRAGSFAAHMSRCVLLVLQLLRDKRDHRRLIQLGACLYKDPESARSKYLRDNERKELAQQAVEMCAMVMRSAVPETNTVDGLMEIYSTVHTAVQVIQDLPRSTAETFRGFLCDAFKNVKDLKATNYDAAFDFCRREKANRKKQAAAEAAAVEAALQASLQHQLIPASIASSSQGQATPASPYLSTVTVSKVPSNPLAPAPSRFPAPSTSWTGMPQASAPTAVKLGRPKKPAWQASAASSGYGPGRMSVEQLLMSMGMNINDLPYSASSVQQGMNFLAQMQQAQPPFRPQQPPKPKPQPKVAPVVSNIVKDRPGISITPLQSGAPRKPLNVPPKNQLVVEPVSSQGAGPSIQPAWPSAPRGRPPLNAPRSGISVVPASRLLKPSVTDSSLAALSRFREQPQLQVTPRPRGRPPNPLNAGRGRQRMNAPTPWPGMPLPMGSMAPGAANAMRTGRPPSPRSHAHAVALARAQAMQELEHNRAKQQFQQLQQQLQRQQLQRQQLQRQQLQRQQGQQMVRPPVRAPAAATSSMAAPPPAAAVAPPAVAPSAAAAASLAAALLDPEIITLE